MNDNSMLYLVLLGFASGFINMFAGGGSMLVVPFLIFLGLPPHVANATNRLFFCKISFRQLLFDRRKY